MIILDTSFIVAYYNTRDENHSKAVNLMNEFDEAKYKTFYMTDYIFDECMTVIFVRLKNLEKTVEIGGTLRKLMQMLTIESDVFEDSWNLFKDQKDTKLSFTDCTTIALMKRENIKNIATFDEDFKKIKGINIRY